MSQGITTAVNHATSFIFGGGMIAAIAQNAPVITVTTVVITGAFSIWINNKNAKTNDRNAATNERRANLNERDMRAKIIKEMEDELQDSLKDK